MMLRTFTAPDMPSALKMVREAMGDEAIILTSEANKGKKGVTITAAVEKKDDPLPFSPPKFKEKLQDSKEIDRIRHDISTVLRFHNIPELFVSKMARNCSDAELSSMLNLLQVSTNTDEKYLLGLALEKLAANYFTFDPLPFESGKIRLMLLGPPGIGKTLTIAKMAAHLTLNKKEQRPQNLAIFTTDNKRAGGVEQLQAFTNILGLELHVATSPKNLAEQIKSLPAHMQVLIDTAGCNPYDHAEIGELKALAAIKTIEPILVLPAGGDSLESIDMVESFSNMPIKRVLVTKADTARRFGGILSAAAAHGLAFCNISSSSSIIDTLQPADGALLAQLLLRYQLQSS